MKRFLLPVLLMLLCADTASGQPTTQRWVADWTMFPETTLTTQQWAPGFDIFSEPLNLSRSTVAWSTSSITHSLTATFTLIGATHNKLYQVGVHIFCNTFPPTFGQFPAISLSGSCDPITRQGVTRKVASVEFGVVTTDIHGNGSFRVVVGPIAPATYHLEFDARNGAGCNLIGGAGSAFCAVDFQSPGPKFGTATTITII
jgi:hypothetical protein